MAEKIALSVVVVGGPLGVQFVAVSQLEVPEVVPFHVKFVAAACCAAIIEAAPMASKEVFRAVCGVRRGNAARRVGFMS